MVAGGRFEVTFSEVGILIDLYINGAIEWILFGWWSILSQNLMNPHIISISFP